MELARMDGFKTLDVWKKSLLLSLLFLLVFCSNFQLSGALFHDGEDPTALGLRLETEFWSEVVLDQEVKYSNKIFSTFQELRGFEIYTREEFIEALEGSNLTSFKIEDAVVSRFKDVLVISYNFTQTIGDLESLPLPSISVWQFIENEKDEVADHSSSSSSSSSSDKKKKASKNRRKKKIRGVWRMVSHSIGVLNVT